MKILSIETSCDETAVSILEATGESTITYRVLGNALLSQVDIHKEYGGVFPTLAKRAHAKNLVPLLEASLEEAELLYEDTQVIQEELRTQISEMLEREPELRDALFSFLTEVEVPEIDAIAVTYGPGLAPALWVGVNLARALALVWNKPLVPINHLEGHVLSSLLTRNSEKEYTLSTPPLPLLSLVISGGHTELVLSKDWLSYEKIGQTRDDAVGEAYDKVARMLGLSYPGGPEVSRLAGEAREADLKAPYKLPRPMHDSDDYDFSFSGLKTAVMYLLKEKEVWSEDEKRMLAREFEDAVADVLLGKAERALLATGSKSLVLAGGVSANSNLRTIFAEKLKEYEGFTLYLPDRALTGDNAIMIGVAGYVKAREGLTIDPSALKADGNLVLS